MVSLSILLKADIRGHKEPDAKTAFVLDQIKKTFSDKVKDLLSSKVPDNFVSNLENVVRVTDGNWKDRLRESLSDELMTASGGYSREGSQKFNDSGEPVKEPKIDMSKIFVAITAHRKVFEQFLKFKEDNAAIILISGMEDSMRSTDNQTQLDKFEESLEEGSDDKAIYDAFKADENIFNKLETAIDTLDKLENQLSRKKRSPRKEYSFLTTLTNLLTKYGKDSRIENYRGELRTLQSESKLFTQKTIFKFLDKYEKGTHPDRLLEVLNNEYSNKKGIDLLKEIFTKRGFKLEEIKVGNLDKLKEFINLDTPASYRKVATAIKQAMNPDATKSQLKVFTEMSESKIIDYADIIELRLGDLLDDKETKETYYLTEPDHMFDEEGLPKDVSIGLADIQNEDYKIELKRTTELYSFMYYLGVLREISLDKAFLRNDVHTVEVESLSEKFAILREVMGDLE